MHCLVVEDQTILLDLLGSVVESFPEVEQVTKADCISTALASSKELPLDLAILDLRLPDGDGCDLGQLLVEQHPNLQLIVLSGAAQDFVCPPALQSSVRAVIDKTDAFEALRHRLTTLIKPAHLGLTARQKEIYDLIGEGKSSKEIAKLLGSALSTVETHRKAISQQLNLSGAELIFVPRPSNTICRRSTNGPLQTIAVGEAQPHHWPAIGSRGRIYERPEFQPGTQQRLPAD